MVPIAPTHFPSVHGYRNPTESSFDMPLFDAVSASVLSMERVEIGAEIWCELRIVLCRIHPYIKRMAQRGSRIWFRWSPP